MKQSDLKVGGAEMKDILAALTLMNQNFATIHISAKSLEQFLLSLYYAKSYLQLKYPIYEYPSQASPGEMICINEPENRITEIHASFTHHPLIAREEKSAAKYEAAYYRTHADYICDPSPAKLAAFKKNEKIVLMYKAHRERPIDPVVSIADDYVHGRVLESVVLRLD